MNSPKLILILILSLSIIQFTNAQITIDGTITDNDSQPIANLLVEIIDENNTINPYKTTTNDLGYYSISGITEVSVTSTRIPEDHIILRNYPNPFNPTTILYYELSKAENIDIQIFDILGRKVRTLFSNFSKAGSHNILWDGRNDWNQSVSAGVYLCRLKTKDRFKVHKMLLLDGGTNRPTVGFSKLIDGSLPAASKINSTFNFSIRVSGSSVLSKDFGNFSCSSDTTINLVVPAILKSVTIGPEGGELDHEDFNLSIPQGALSQSIELKLGIEIKFDSSEDEFLSNTYRIDGFPQIYSKPLLLRIKMEKNHEDSISIAIGEKQFTMMDNREIISYDYLSARDSSQFTIVNIPVPDVPLQYSKGLKKSNNNEVQRWFVALLSPGKILSKNKRFRIFYPKSINEYILLIDDFLEDGVTEFNRLGFKKDDDTQMYKLWPMEVRFTDFIDPFPNTHNNIYAMITIFDEGVGLKINKDKVNESEMNKLQKEISDEIYLFYSITRSTKLPIFTQEFYWFHKAVTTWAHEYFPRNMDYVPREYVDHWSKIFNGLQIGAGNLRSDYEKHGYAVSSLVKYFTKVYGEQIVSQIFHALKKDISAVEAMLDTIPAPEYIWWTDFFKEYLSGNVYGLESDDIISNIKSEDIFTIQDENDTLKIFSHIYPDLSARLFKVDLNYPEIDDTVKLNFGVGPMNLNLNYVTVMVFLMRDGKMEYLNHGVNVITPEMKELMGEGISSLVACVVNSGNEPPYNGSSDIDLEVSFVEDSPDISIVKINFGYLVKGKFNHENDVPTERHTGYNLHLIDADYDKDGSFGWFETYHNAGTDNFGYDYDTTWRKSISGRIDTNLNAIVNLKAEWYSFNHHELFVKNESIRGIQVNYPIPFKNSIDNWENYEVREFDIDLSKIMITYRADTYDRYGEHTWSEFVEPIGDVENKISIEIHY